MACSKVAIVTGANKGIGYEIVKGLCERFDGTVYLTARNKSKGLEAIQKLEEKNLVPIFHELDVNCQQSCDKLRSHLLTEHGGIDVLVNNAGIYLGDVPNLSFAKQTEQTIETNYFGLMRVCHSLLGLLRPGGRVVNMTSRAGHLSWLPSQQLRAHFDESGLSISKITCLMSDFVRCAKRNIHISNGWGDQPYSISKIGVSALTIVQQKSFDKYYPNDNKIINCVHPGDIKTEMSNYEGDFLPEYGAQTPIFLCLLPEGECVYRGSYVWHDKKIYDWYGKDPHLIRNPPTSPCQASW